MMMIQTPFDQLAAAHQQLLGGQRPTLHVRSPGRVNLIGEHTDYNAGFVLPIAMSQALHVLAAPAEDGRLVFASTAFPDKLEFDAKDPGPPSPAPARWGDYVRGVAAMLRLAGGELRGGRFLIHSEVPIGGGVSSSAALEVGAATAMLGLAHQSMESIPLALLARQAEHEYAHSPCGIMDQFICVLGHAGHALLLDCRSQGYEQIPMPAGEYKLMVMDTQVKHNLGSSEYPVRQRQCREGLSVLQAAHPGLEALRDVILAQLTEQSKQIDALTLRRCRHVVSEIERTVRAAEALRASDVRTFGRLMYESHTSLRDDYEVSCAELDALVELTRDVPGVHGSRMTGGGFGGCAIAWIDASAEHALREAVSQRYDGRFSKPALVYSTKASDGVSLERL
jgi:galactokinase